MAAMTSFHAEKCCHRVNAHATSAAAMHMLLQHANENRQNFHVWDDGYPRVEILGVLMHNMF